MDLNQQEAFALATDRAKALEQFIPGTEDYYFHACLLHEQAANFVELDAVLQQWTHRFGNTPRNREIHHRRALLRHAVEPDKTREYLRQQLGLQFNHQRQVAGKTARHPSALDPGTTARSAIRKLGFAYSHSGDLTGFTESALDWLVDESMEGARLRQLLARVTRPDHPRLVERVLAELSERHSPGFGSVAIHANLLLDQLEALAIKKPDLLANESFVHAWLRKLQPGPDVEWQTDPDAREAYLERLWTFVKSLAPSFGPLKALVLYHFLDQDRRRGKLDRARFLEYLKLPRMVPYANPDHLERVRDPEFPFPLGADLRGPTLLPPVPDDQELVRDLLAKIFLDESDTSEFEPYVQLTFLREVLATTKLLHGIGDREQWISLLDDPGALAALKDRVEIRFAPTNPGHYRANDPVTLDLDVKNVPTLVVKVFEIQALHHFLATGRDVDTSIDLDGLVAGKETTCTYDDPPVRRVRRRFELPALAGPGVFVVEFIGGGISSRALIRKGRLRFVERIGASGHVFAILDEERRLLPDASLWLGGREFRAEDGEIRVPFTTNPGRREILLRHGAVTTVEAFEHRSEQYEFAAGFHVDRECLLAGREALVLLRPTLRIHGTPVDPALLEARTLEIRSTDREGVSASIEISDFPLQDDRESTHTFQVPAQLASITFTLRARVRNVSQDRNIDLSDTHEVQINGIDATPSTEALHLARNEQGYSILLLGKSGEPRSGRVLNLRIRHRDLVPLIDVELQTDEAGRVFLGHLPEVLAVAASTPAGIMEMWELPQDRCRRPASLHAREGEPIRIPHLPPHPIGATGPAEETGGGTESATTPDPRQWSLLEIAGGTFVRNRFSALRLEDGYLVISGLPAGDYDLLAKREGARISVRIVPGEDRAGWIAGARRHLERGPSTPLHVVSIQPGQKEIEIRIGHPGPSTRVHVIATRMLPCRSAFAELGRAGGGAEPRAMEVFRGPSQYVSGRDIGDEYRYVLERRYARKYAGNLLARPGLLLNPWAVRNTETATQKAAVGGEYAAAPAPMAASMADHASRMISSTAPAGSFASLDFLPNPATVLANLRPDETGVLRIPRSSVGHARQIRVVAVRDAETVCRDSLLAEVDAPPRDLRLRLSLAAEAHFTERKRITVLAPGQPLEIADLTTSTVEVYDSLARVYRLLATLSGNATLTLFGFILRWPRLMPQERQARYSEFACHELSFFLSCKDPVFFRDVIAPYLRNKKEKTFLDRYLLEDDLSAYRTPWAYGRLNAVERILLSRRFEDEGDPCARHVSDRFDLLPRDPAEADRLFQAAIRGRDLEAGDALGIRNAREEAQSEMLEQLELDEERSPSKDERAPLRRSMEKRAAKGKAARFDQPSESSGALDDALLEAGGPPASMPRAPGAGGVGFRARDLEARERMRPFYQKLDRTQEWAENHYYHLPIEQQGPDLVTVNAFWRDYARHRFQGPFLSPHVARASRNFTEMMFALSVLDLPFEAEAPKVEFQAARMKWVGPARAIAFHKEIMPSSPADPRGPVLVSQNYFRDDDRKRFEDGEEVDHYVTGEFLVTVPYTCQVVLTNPTSSMQKLELLLQIPQGAIPVHGGFVTRGMPVELDAYATRSIEYSFYFPSPGAFVHFPVHVSKSERLIAFAEPRRLSVVREPTTVDETSWAWVSQHGDAKTVLRWMETNNLERLARHDDAGRIGLEQIAWRMRDRMFYQPCLALLRGRHIWNDTLWSYSLLHGDVPNLREFLLHQDRFLAECGESLDSPLLRINPVARGRYQHLEYAPLVNARVGRLGARRKILNDRFAAQYSAFLNILRYKPAPDDADRLALSTYLLLQDRIEEGLNALAGVDPARIETRLQHDYLTLYAELLREQPANARSIAARHREHPVHRWRDLFRSALAQIDEISGVVSGKPEEEDREQRQARLAATEPGLDFKVENRTVRIHYQNLASVLVHYYRMDIELLFSRQPFVQQQSGQFGFIRPNRADEVSLPSDRREVTLDLPAELHGANVIVELVAAGKRKAQAYYSHDLAIQVTETYGRLRVTRSGTGAPLPRNYIKVYARMIGGEVRFYKDGYTDLRGVFDYTSLSTNETDFVERFALLALHEQHGSVILEAGVPGR